MILPKLTPPTFRTVLPISGVEVKFRPYLTGDKKTILMALEGDKPDPKLLQDAMIEVSKNCVMSPEGFDPGRLPAPDMQWLMLQLRAKSEGENIKLNLQNYNCPQDKSCVIEASVDVDTMALFKDPAWTDKIMITETVGVKMRVPTLNEAKRYIDLGAKDGNVQKVNEAYDLIILCMEQVYTEDEAWVVSSLPREEVRAFVDQLTEDQLRKINAFFRLMPHMRKDIEVKCPRCEKQITHTIQGFSDFFV